MYPVEEKMPVSRWLLIVLVGPFIGSVTLFGLAALLDPPPGAPDDWLAMLAMVLMFGWVVGLLPAVLAALLWSNVPKVWSLPKRALACVAAGAVCGVIGSLPALSLFAGGFPPLPIRMVVVMAASGAVALLVTALPGSGR